MNDLELWLLVLMAGAAYVVYRATRLLFASRFKKRIITKNAPLLISYYSYNRSLMGVSNTQVDDLTISYFTSYGESLVQTNDLEQAIHSDADTALMVSVHLPFRTTSHLVGITQRGRQELGLQEFLAQRKLEIIELEGDFPSTFLLYAPPGNQFNARYVFDPKAMAFVVDFCKTHHFEVVGDMLYIVSSRATEAANSEESFSNETIKQFVKEIKPALVIASDQANINPARLKYGSARTTMQCPRCQASLRGEDGQYRCERGHGVLLSGAQLIRLKKPVAPQRILTETQLAEQPGVDCPNCMLGMKPVDYQQTGVVIDACMQCGYRWLDNGEDVLMLKG